MTAGHFHLSISQGRGDVMYRFILCLLYCDPPTSSPLLHTRSGVWFQSIKHCSYVEKKAYNVNSLTQKAPNILGYLELTGEAVDR